MNDVMNFGSKPCLEPMLFIYFANLVYLWFKCLCDVASLPRDFDKHGLLFDSVMRRHSPFDVSPGGRYCIEDLKCLRAVICSHIR